MKKGLEISGGNVYSLRSFFYSGFTFCLPCSHWEQSDRNVDLYFH